MCRLSIADARCKEARQVSGDYEQIHEIEQSCCANAENNFNNNYKNKVNKYAYNSQISVWSS